MNPQTSDAFPTLITDLVAWRAEHESDRIAFRFEEKAGGENPTTLTYGQLHRQALGVAALIRTFAASGEEGQPRVVVAEEPGLNFVVAFVGCLYAGCIAVPVQSPRGRILSRDDRLGRLIEDADPVVIISSQETGDQWRAIAGSVESVHLGGAPKPPSLLEPAPVVESDIAFIQYTSGSTGDPKGVAVTFGNLSHNLEQIRHRFGHGADSRGVIWLPPYHDMGLIGGILQPIHVGFPVLLMSPVSFVRNPFRWLNAISQFRATTSGGPNFAFEYAVKRITAEQKAELDLSSWAVAFVGSEAVRERALARFAEAFEGECGFSRAAFLPCYGLAESTLMVSGRSGIPRVERGIVSCGRPVDGLDVCVVEPESDTPLPEGDVGEIRIAGDSVASGYWRREEETQKVFGGSLKKRGRAEDSSAYLRTGDLGFLLDGEIFVSGRLKDIIVIRGQNFFPADIENCIAEAADLEDSSVAAFSVDDGSDERLIVAIECRPGEVGAIDLAILRGAVSNRFALQVHEFAFVKRGGLPRTTSGKLRRNACRERFIDHALTLISPPLPTRGGEGSAAGESRQSIEAVITAIISRKLKKPASEIARRQPLAELGIDSLMAIEMAEEITNELGLAEPLDATIAWRYPTVEMLGRHLSQSTKNHGTAPFLHPNGEEAIAIVGMACRFPGRSDSPKEFWRLLYQGSDAVGGVPPDRWEAEHFYDPDPEAPGKMYTKAGAFIDGVAEFDAGFFGISPREAAAVDPQQRLLLESSYLALADGGFEPFEMRASRTGVYVGLSLDDYAMRSVRSGDLTLIDQHHSLGSHRGVAAGRVGYLFGFQGPAIQLDTTCSSSLVAVHLACQALKGGEADVALAGGVNLMLSPEATIACCKLRALSTDGRCATFSEHADGYVRGEGCGVLAVQRLSDAVADGREIYAVIRGSAVNHDGVSNGLTAPNGDSQ
ncbi:MAG: beta-ketoacyl synthase N-terminal-like domain-containing protein, partial [Verrucomicrobiota bacterium]